MGNEVIVEMQNPVENFDIMANRPVSAPCQWMAGVSSTPPGKTDEDFFQLMCHVEPGLRVKIENGEFVDLEKLLPKDKCSA